MSNILINNIRLQSFANERNRLEVGDSVRIEVQFAEVVLQNGVPQLDTEGLKILDPTRVTVDTFSDSRIPILALSNGGKASYVGGSGSDTLVFEYTVKDTDNSTRLNSALRVIAFAENDAALLSTDDLVDDQLTSGIRRADVTIRPNIANGFESNDEVLPPENSGVDSVTVVATEIVVVDLVPPRLTSINSVSGTYGVGDSVEFTVSFN